MDFELTKEMQQTVEQVRWLGKEYLRPLGVEADRRGEPIPPDHEFYQRWAAMGMMARGISLEEKKKEEGRERTSARQGVLLAEEASYWDRGAAVTLPSPGLGGPPVMKMGTKEQKKRFLSIFFDTSSPKWGAFGMTESGVGSDVARIRTRCEKVGKEWVLNGDKMFCSNAKRASWIVIFATVDPSLGRAGHRAFVVEKPNPGIVGLKVEKKMGLIAYETCSFMLENCRVPEGNLLGGEAYYEGKRGFVGAMKSFDDTRPVIGAMAVGVARAAFERVRELWREGFLAKRPLPLVQKVQEKLVTMERKLETAKLLCWRAAWMADAGVPNTLEASIAKAYAAQAGFEICQQALEIVGEAGIRQDYLLEKWFRDVKAMDIVEGTGQIQRVVIARRIAGFPHEV